MKKKNLTRKEAQAKWRGFCNYIKRLGLESLKKDRSNLDVYALALKIMAQSIMKSLGKSSDLEEKVYYLDGVHWQHEVDGTKVRFWRTRKELMANSPCASECGIVKVYMTAKWIKKQKL